ncbi:ABC transporter, ATP-binding protein [Capnocytophaga ochracea F0287]|uniref:ABC transporter, ATP-binding protein n=1 Tax=Capnocytophaga ochracea F0287 TaxID=873517 RepID=E4MPC5_CAPOC|nr:ABC transporter ATP-binding protein [Capnocytophaga ochracea]EFS98476.1 ABC transporter, ATP-binding protein [Capnocytophaga ochracea F0287]EJF43121.1 ABC transporter, ATP-binding protein [Capnocytophaga ochracea str. Holt 25]UEB43281.1 ABC transporter ATP-binding protein [Capnocytophaga ochracea]
MITFSHIHKNYNGKEFIADFNLTIESGTFLTIIGTSGSGKTTVLKMINGLVLPDKGEIYIDGKNILEEDLIALRRNIGYVIQGNILFPHLTVAENIAYVLRLKNYSKTNITHIVTEKLQQVNLDPELANRFPHQLSGGQQQRVGIARALAASPSIILMDEPFGALDIITRQQLQRELKALHQLSGATIVFVTHDIAEALTLGTKVLVLDKGAIQQYDTPEMIKSNPANEFVRQLVN